MHPLRLCMEERQLLTRQVVSIIDILLKTGFKGMRVSLLPVGVRNMGVDENAQVLRVSVAGK